MEVRSKHLNKRRYFDKLISTATIIKNVKMVVILMLVVMMMMMVVVVIMMVMVVMMMMVMMVMMVIGRSRLMMDCFLGGLAACKLMN